MSYDIRLLDDHGSVIRLPERHDLRGGRYLVGGTDEAYLNVTYNYVDHFRRVLGEKGIRWLHGRRASATVTKLQEAVIVLGVDRKGDYWESTPGHAGAALADLLRLAGLAPAGIWEVH